MKLYADSNLSSESNRDSVSVRRQTQPAETTLKGYQLIPKEKKTNIFLCQNR